MTFLFGTGFEEGNIIYGMGMNGVTVAPGSLVPSWHASNPHIGKGYWYDNVNSNVYYRVVLGTPLAEFYEAFWFYRAAGSAGNVHHWMNAVPADMGVLKLNAVTAALDAYVGAGLVASGARVAASSQWHLIELHVKISDDPAIGKIRTRVDGILDIDYTGDTKPGADATVTNLGFNGPSGVATMRIDDWTIHDTNGVADFSWPGDCRYYPVCPTGNGTTSGLTGSDGDQVNNYLLVDDLATVNNDGDTTYNRAAADGEYDTYQTTDPSLGSGVIKRYLSKVIQRKTNAAVATTHRHVLRSNGVDYDNGNDLVMSASYGVSVCQWDTDPDTGAAWTPDGLNNAELLGVKGTGAFA